jgi:flagellar assembly factor FliW
MSTTATAVSFTAPMPGLEPELDFVLRGVHGAPGLYALEAAARPELRLFLADAALYVPDYSPNLPAESLDELQLTGTAGPTTLVVINPASGNPTVNLQAPIVLNPQTNRCTQVVLDGRDYPLRAELAAA